MLPPSAAFGAGITLAALFMALPKAVVWRSFVPVLNDRRLEWRHVVLACVGLAVAGIWKPLAASLLLLALLAAIASFTDLTPSETATDLGSWE